MARTRQAAPQEIPQTPVIEPVAAPKAIRPVVVEEVDPIDAYVDEILGDEPSEDEEIESQDTESEAEEEQPDIEETEDEEEPQEEEFLEIVYRGKPKKLNLEEVKDLVQQGFDYNLKMQSVGEERRALENDKATFVQQIQTQQQVQAETAELIALDMQLQPYNALSMADWSNWTNTDPVEAQKGWQTYQLLKQQRTDKENSVLHQRTQLQNRLAVQQREFLAKANEQLSVELGSAWNAETKNAIKSFALNNYGFSEQELDGLADPRMVKVLFDAFKQKQSMERQNQITKKVASAPPIGKVGKKPVADPQRKQLQKMLKSSNRKVRETAVDSLLDKFIS